MNPEDIDKYGFFHAQKFFLKHEALDK